MIVIRGKTKDLGDGFNVSRVLPQIERRAVGPFVFFDYFGPSELKPGKGLDVRPHPHIGLATVTYLFDGGQVHRDSLGTVQPILPGDVNWMTAGRGIVHSERTSDEDRAGSITMHGVQSWVGLPQAFEEMAPEFHHFARNDLPSKEEGGVRLRVITGAAYGLKSPVRTFSDIFYVDAEFAADASLAMTDEHEERAVFVVKGALQVGDELIQTGDMAVLDADEAAKLSATQGEARALLLGGEPLDGPRHIWWNFVSSSKERIEQAKRDWKDQKIGKVEGDDEFIPLPD
ncbi:MAG: pirin family protein [Rhizobiales bacterium]|nr:pirin family protein [Hyphomicrobiales bacterium]